MDQKPMDKNINKENKKLDTDNRNTLIYKKPYVYTNNTELVYVKCDICGTIIKQDAMYYHGEDNFDLCFDCGTKEKKREKKKKYLYGFNEKVLCYSAEYDHWYSAIIIKRKCKHKQPQYKVHYIGWHAMHDEYVLSDQLCKGSNDKQILGQLLKEKNAQCPQMINNKKRKLNVVNTQRKKRKLDHKEKNVMIDKEANKNMNEWSVEEVVKFLEQKFPDLIEKYSHKFVKNKIDGRTLQNMGHEEWEYLGVEAMLMRINIIKYVREKK